MNIVDENKYNEFKNILNGCQSIGDAKYFAEIYLKQNPECKKLVYALLNGKSYSNKYDFKTYHNIMIKINKCDFQEDCIQIINDLYPNKNENDIQIMTLMRIINNKKKKDTDKYVKKIKSNDIIKHCPHCAEKYVGNLSTIHVICGYKDLHHGFDWIGCQKDWCFVCGKKLCKSWNDDKLFLEPNRIHNSECCKQDAFLNNESYLNHYCQCHNRYVDRTRNI
jgi:hypothetical protein